LELFYVIAITANVLLTGVCAYCLSVAISRSVNTPENDYLFTVSRIIRKVVIVGGIGLILFVVYALVLLTAMAFN
jgi:hypothetical protein